LGQRRIKKTAAKQMLELEIRSAKFKMNDDGRSGLLIGFDTAGFPLAYTIPRAILERFPAQIQRELKRVPKPARRATSVRI
jgi:hypothetical protein